MKSRRAISNNSVDTSPSINIAQTSTRQELEHSNTRPRSLYAFFGAWIVATVLPGLFPLVDSTILMVLVPDGDLLSLMVLVGLWGALWLVGCIGTIVTLAVAAHGEVANPYPRAHRHLIAIMSVILFFLPSFFLMFTMHSFTFG